MPLLPPVVSEKQIASLDVWHTAALGLNGRDDQGYSVVWANSATNHFTSISPPCTLLFMYNVVKLYEALPVFKTKIGNYVSEVWRKKNARTARVYRLGATWMIKSK